jgi:hypothetical protein
MALARFESSFAVLRARRDERTALSAKAATAELFDKTSGSGCRILRHFSITGAGSVESRAALAAGMQYEVHR